LGDYTHLMTNQQFKPPPANHDIEIMIDGKTYKGAYHLERNNIVVSYQGASKMVSAGPDNDSLAKNLLTEIVSAKRGLH
jgi:hypothetical protein